MTDKPELLAELTASPARRIMGVGSQVCLGILMLAVAFLRPPASPIALLILLGLGGLAIWQARNLWKATSLTIGLTEEGLWDNSGTLLTTFDNIEKVDRGVFAMKPSNGFLIVLKKPMERRWRPGMWWRFGRRLGVGGTPAGRHARDMADRLTMMIHMRDT